MTTRIPVTIITGFLGAGKTSLVTHIVNNNGGRKLALLINEFGDLGVDKELLLGCAAKLCSDNNVVELANGCICCTVAEDFVPAMETLLTRDVVPEHILIETSGLALPKPLIQAFNWPELRANITVDGVISVVDGAAVYEGRFAHDLDQVEKQRASDPSLDHESPLEEVFEDQLTCADMVILNKADLLDKLALEYVHAYITNHIRPGVAIFHATHGQVAPEILLDLEARAESDLFSRTSHHDNVDGEHDHDHFESFTVEIGPVDNVNLLQKQLSKLIQTHKILRIKGFINRPNRDRREVIQGVGPRIQRYFDREWKKNEKRQTRIVFITETGVKAQSIASAIEGQLG